MLKVLITGASGFIGRSLSFKLLHNSAFDLTALLRSHNKASIKSVVLNNFSSIDDLKAVLSGIDVVIHLAARVHVMNENSSNALVAFRRVNVDITKNLALASVQCNVRRFIFLSSIKVNGETTYSNKPFKSDLFPSRYKSLKNASKETVVSKNVDPYALSKFEAEQDLKKICINNPMELVIIRPPLVYGNGVGGNFEKMMQWVHAKKLIPFGGIFNQRSFVYIDNLVNLIERCIIHPNAGNQTFLVSDGKDLSTNELFRILCNTLSERARLVRVPPILLKLVLLTTNKRNIYQRLCQDLKVEIDKTCDLLQWHPETSIEEGLEITAKAWLDSLHKI